MLLEMMERGFTIKFSAVLPSYVFRNCSCLIQSFESEILFIAVKAVMASKFMRPYLRNLLSMFFYDSMIFIIKLLERAEKKNCLCLRDTGSTICHCYLKLAVQLFPQSTHCFFVSS